MTLPMNNSLTLQRTVDDLQRRLALLESMIKVTGKDMIISTPGNLMIQAGRQPQPHVRRESGRPRRH
jgi:hypothetical protein